MLASPDASTAAAADAPSGTTTARPSTVTAMVAAGASDRRRNIKALGRERRQGRVERAGGDHRREQIGVRSGEGHAAVAIGGESAGKAFRLIVDRQAVGR